MPNPSTKRPRVNTRVKSRIRDSGVFAAGDAPGEGVQVEAVRIRHCQHPAEHDRRHPAAGQAMALDRGQHRFRVELAVHAQRPAHPQHRDARQVERADVVQRPHHQQLLAGRQPQRDHMVDGFPVEVAVGVHHALGPRRGARRIHQAHQVGFGHGGLRRDLQAGLAQPARIGLGLRVDDDLGRLQRDDGVELLVHQQQLGAGVAQDIGGLGRGQSVVDRQEHRPQVAGGEGQLQESRAVLHEQRHHVVLADAARVQHGGRLENALVELGVADLLVAVDDGRLVGRAPGVEGNRGAQIEHDGWSPWMCGSFARVAAGAGPASRFWVLSMTWACQDRVWRCSSGSSPRTPART